MTTTLTISRTQDSAVLRKVDGAEIGHARTRTTPVTLDRLINPIMGNLPVAISRCRRVRGMFRPAPVPRLARAKVLRGVRRVAIAPPNIYEADRTDAGGFDQTLTFAVPEHGPRFVSVATFRELLSARPTDTVYRWTAGGWRIVGAELINLRDKTQRYQLGRIQVYS